MERKRYNWENIGVVAELSLFAPQGGVEECHAMLHVESRREMFEAQLQRLMKGVAALRLLPELSGAAVVFKRYFLSDATNQRPLIKDEDKCTVSYIQQPPLDGSKVALWIYLQRGTKVTYDADALGSTVVEHNGYRHIWSMGMTENEGGSYEQTETLLEKYENALARYGANIADNCVRTWFFVRDVDTNYGGLVVARRENFEKNGLRRDTHYISSTGIGGSPVDTKALVQLGTYAVTGLHEGQQRYLYALDHLNKTIEYGVTFERATLVEYGDRGHIYVSGTASINHKGEVVHVSDVRLQTLRMIENVEALLNEGGMSFADVMQIIVYLRDTADYALVSEMMKERFPDMPCVITLAPVCRPTWLIEMECIAVSPNGNPEYEAL